MDLSQLSKDAEPLLLQVLTAATAVVVAAIGYVGTLIGFKVAQIRQAQLELTKLQQGKQIAEISAKAAQQDPKLVTNEQMKESVLNTMSATVPDLGDHLHDKLAEAAVLDLKNDTKSNTAG
jgi:hypothetical protein